MKSYTPTNLPPKYREWMLRHISKQQEHVILHRKAKEALRRAASKLAACNTLRIYEEDCIRQIINTYSSDDALDADFKKDNTTLEDIISSWNETERESAEQIIQTCLFSLDCFEEYWNKLYYLLAKMLPYTEFSEGYFTPLREQLKPITDSLLAYHKQQDERYEEKFADEADKICDYINKRSGIFRRKLKRKK